MKTLVPAIIFILFATLGCFYNSVEYSYPQIFPSCDTLSITFNHSVRPIIDQSCFSCHSNSTAPSYGGNIRLENCADVKAQADNGKLLGSISHAGGFSPMPKNSSKLQGCKITIVRKWIEGGAPNN